MDELKKDAREVVDGAKKAWRGRDGEDLGDKVANAGDDIRRTAANAGDDMRNAKRNAERDAERDAEATKDQADELNRSPFGR